MTERQIGVWNSVRRSFAEAANHCGSYLKELRAAAVERDTLHTSTVLSAIVFSVHPRRVRCEPIGSVAAEMFGKDRMII